MAVVGNLARATMAGAVLAAPLAGPGPLVSPAWSHAEGSGVPLPNCGPNVQWRFVGSGWTANQKNWVREGFNWWNGPKRFNGTQIASHQEVWATNVIDVSIDNGLGDDVYGSASCSSKRIRFHENEIGPNNAARWRAVAAHEIGHLHSLTHTGTGDNLLGSELPVMSTCTNQHSNMYVTADDYAHLNTYRTSDTRLPNGGFESGGGFWKTRGWATFSTSSAWPFQGAWNGVLSSAGTQWGDHTYTAVSKYSPAYSLPTNNIFQFRSRTSGVPAGPNVRGVAVARGYAYQDDASPDCNWPKNSSAIPYDVNQRNWHSAWEVIGTSDAPASGSWTTTSVEAIFPNVGFVDYEFRVRNLSGSGTVHYDNVSMVT